MNVYPQAWTRSGGEMHSLYDSPHLQRAEPKSHTQSPLVTGTSVVALKFKDGVVIAADNLASYGSLARFTNVKRLRQFNSRVVLGFGGDVSDMQHLDRMLNSLSIRENYLSNADTSDTSASSADDSNPAITTQELHARNLHTYIQKAMYRRRSELNPLWNAILIAGLDGAHSPFLASVDLLGTTFESPSLATGFGAHLAQPLLRKKVPTEAEAKNLSKDEAVSIVKECMKVLFYRDARSMDRYSIAVVERTGAPAGEGATAAAAEGASTVEMKDDEKLEQQSWAFAEGIRGYGTQVN